jgi:hypothetical protein
MDSKAYSGFSYEDSNEFFDMYFDPFSAPAVEGVVPAVTADPRILPESPMSAVPISLGNFTAVKEEARSPVEIPTLSYKQSPTSMYGPIRASSNTSSDDMSDDGSDDAANVMRRKLRNRDSARRSRLRKQERMSDLEKKVDEYARENNALHRRLSELESSNRCLHDEILRLKDLAASRIAQSEQAWKRSDKLASEITVS